MEYHCGNKDAPLASRIFEKAMELYGDEVEFVLRYLGFLISINDENSASSFCSLSRLADLTCSPHRRKSAVRACDRDVPC